jgi:hypothetical protein
MLDRHRHKPRRRARALAAALAACAAVVALPAAGYAAVTTLGSDLKKPADTVEAHGADSAFWMPTIDGASGAVPANGQITIVKVKGIVLADPRGRAKPDPMFHVQILHPIGRGRVKVDLTSGAFRVPVGGNPQAVSSFKPINLCVHKGDYVDFNDIGGFEWRWGNYGGMPFQVFSRTPLTTTNFYSKNAGTNNGNVFAPAASNQGEELLMQYQLGTGPDAVSICPGGFKEHAFKGLQVQSRKVSVGGGSARMRVQCPFRTYGSCRGVLVLKAKLNGRLVTLGGAPFSIPQAWSKSVYVGISGKNANEIRRAGGVNASAIADGHDDPGSGGAPRGMPVQRKTTTSTVRLNG